MASQGNVADGGEVEFWESCPLCRSESELAVEARQLMRWLEGEHQWPLAKCQSCNGNGEVVEQDSPDSSHTFSEICALCDGSGLVRVEAACPVCKDIGTISPDRLVEIWLMHQNAKAS